MRVMRRMSRFAIKKGERKGQVDMMHNTVVIKSNKAGMTVYLEPEVCLLYTSDAADEL